MIIFIHVAIYLQNLVFFKACFMSNVKEYGGHISLHTPVPRQQALKKSAKETRFHGYELSTVEPLSNTNTFPWPLEIELESLHCKL